MRNRKGVGTSKLIPDLPELLEEENMQPDFTSVARFPLFLHHPNIHPNQITLTSVVKTFAAPSQGQAINRSDTTVVTGREWNARLVETCCCHSRS